MTANHWLLTDVDAGVHVESFQRSASDAPAVPAQDWHITKRTLCGGLSDGVELIELCNGPMTVRILPTRGGGIWNAEYRGIRLGWDAPIRGPVHPKFVNLADRNGLGWLAGFDEWLCRCGLTSNGPPGDDRGTPLTLHGRIANSPAYYVEAGIEESPPYTLYVKCQVEEGGLFLGRLRLTSTISTMPGTNRISIHDQVENLASSPAEFELLYHLNFGPPLLEQGSKVFVPVRQMAPLTARAAEDIDRYETYFGPTPGYSEQVYGFCPADDAGRTLAVLCNASAGRGAAITWNTRQLPYFTVWKNTIPLEDGYVTGLEPATNFPYFKSHERAQGRVPTLPPGGRWEATWSIEVLDSALAVEGAKRAVAAIQAGTTPIIHRTPVWGPEC